jgi:hypothetical protein
MPRLSRTEIISRWFGKNKNRKDGRMKDGPVEKEKAEKYYRKGHKKDGNDKPT